MRIKVNQVRSIADKKTNVVIHGINQFSEIEIKQIIEEAFLRKKIGVFEDDFCIVDKVLYKSDSEKNPFDHLKVAHGLDYCIITRIAPYKFRSGGIGYTLYSPDQETFVAIVSKKQLIHYVD